MSGRESESSAACLGARALFAQGDISNALKLLDAVIQADPTSGMAHADRGTLYSIIQRRELALQDLERALSLGYGYAATYCSAASVCSELKQHRKALDYFAEAVRLDPDYPFTYYNRAEMHRELGDVEAAVSDLEKCLELGPDDNLRQLIVGKLSALRSLK
jgi:tetratricopeptide (TPR) repeat protein